MDLIEIRDLDGPNLFALYPTIKLEVRLLEYQRLSDAARARLGALGFTSESDDLISALAGTIATLHRLVGIEPPPVGWRRLDPEDHYAIFFAWEWRACALAIARTAYELVCSSGSKTRDPLSEIRNALQQDGASGARPTWLRDDQRTVPSIAVTGTNGKTTTTRLLAHIARQSGKRTGWSSSTGVYIDGQLVLDGDYTGPAGAQRVLTDPSIEFAVLETARGGILLRGLGYESNDVGVFLNVSADHLGLYGIERLETLAETKSVVVQVTRPDGVAVLNADDPLVLACRTRVRAEILLIGQNPDNQAIREHLATGGRALVRDDDRLTLLQGGTRIELLRLNEIPMTFGGVAHHMVENALAAAGAAIGFGFSLYDVAAGLRTFRSDVRLNFGRLNVFHLDDRLVVIDYAHNEIGLDALIRFTRAVMQPEGRLFVVIGTAGDREDDVFRGLGRIAGQHADRVYIKENPRYYRGREPGTGADLMCQGMLEIGGIERLHSIFPSEQAAFRVAVDQARPGDAVAVMCVEDQEVVLQDLHTWGAKDWVS